MRRRPAAVGAVRCGAVAGGRIGKLSCNPVMMVRRRLGAMPLQLVRQRGAAAPRRTVAARPGSDGDGGRCRAGAGARRGRRRLVAVQLVAPGRMVVWLLVVVVVEAVVRGRRWTDGHDRWSEVLQQGALGVLQLLQPLGQVIVGRLQLLEALGHFAILRGFGGGLRN